MASDRQDPTVRVVTTFATVIDGQPVPQGSKAATVRNGRAVMFDANKKLRPWRKLVRDTIREVDPPVFEGPVAVKLHFRLERPASVTRRARPLPHVPPDIDKLARAVLDGATDAGVWADDGQVVQLLADKRYGTNPGVTIIVTTCNQ